MIVLDRVRRAVSSVFDDVLALRRDFHAHPELGLEEHRTAEKIETYLAEKGIKTSRVAGTGVVGLIGGSNPGPVLLLRADIDALPIEEATGVSYRSKHPGVMHACGHDAHTAMLLGAAGILNEMKSELKGTVKLVFQPNEENIGALQVIDEGVLKNPNVDGAMSLHIWTPLPTGQVAVSGGPVMAGLELFKITVKGKGGHTGYPETAVDPVLAAADIVQTAQRIQTREISLMKPTVIMFGRVSGGTKANIIPDAVTLEGSIRTLCTTDSEESPGQRLRRLSERLAAVHGCVAVFESLRENNPLVNDCSLARLAAVAAGELEGGEEMITELTTMASEDFSEFASRVPGVYLFLGAGNREKQSHYPHHSPFFNIDESALPRGVELYVRFALHYFNRGGELEAKAPGTGRHTPAGR